MTAGQLNPLKQDFFNRKVNKESIKTSNWTGFNCSVDLRSWKTDEIFINLPYIRQTNMNAQKKLDQRLKEINHKREEEHKAIWK